VHYTGGRLALASVTKSENTGKDSGYRICGERSQQANIPVALIVEIFRRIIRPHGVGSVI
jgi:hypothetical protein